MKTKRNRVILFLVVVLMGFIITRFSIDYIRISMTQNKFLAILEEGKFDNLSLTIYYINPYSFTLMPLTIDNVVEGYDYKVVIDGKSLEENAEALEQLGRANFVPFTMKTHLDARIYYVFETEEGIILDVAMWGSHDILYIPLIYVNGISVFETSFLYNIALDYLPEKEKNNLKKFAFIED